MRDVITTLSVKKESAVYCQKGSDETSKNFRDSTGEICENRGAQGQLKHTIKFQPGKEVIKKHKSL